MTPLDLSQDPAERRKSDRIDCHFPANFNLIFPEEAFTPVATIVLVTDVSDLGVKVICPPFQEPFNNCIPREGLYAKLHSRVGERSVSLHCQVKWVTVKRHEDGRPYTELGLSYHRRYQPHEADGAERLLKRGRETSRRGRTWTSAPRTASL